MKYRIGFEDPAVKSPWSERMLYTDPHAVIIVGPAAPFAFGEVKAVCPNREMAEYIVNALNAYRGDERCPVAGTW